MSTVRIPAVFIALFAGIFLLESAGQERAAYMAKTVERRFSPGGVETEMEMITDAVRDNGSQVKIVRKIAPTKQWVDVKTVIDLKSKERIEFEPLTESRTTSPLSARYVQYLLTKPKSCGEGSAAERDKILEQEVIKVQNEYNLPNGKVDRVERWLAPALNCFPLRERFSRGPKKGPFELKMTRDVTMLSLGEPDSKLFLSPPGFKERTASEVATEFKRKYPKLAEEGCGPCTTTPSAEAGP
ncbi:MAG TPA: hypothetical protein VMW38_19555 [Terriglobia bacterium]|nr:hypothetical protein [Terriglobia bacterium]